MTGFEQSSEEHSSRSPIARIAAYVRKDGGRLLVELLVNFVLPFVIYNYAEAPLGAVRALLLSSAPPILWSLVEFSRHRRLDALSVLVVAGIALSLLAMLGGGGVRFLQLREKLVTGVIGLVFVGSALIGKPLVYELARATMRRRSENEAQEFEALKIYTGFRRTMAIMTLVWGFGLLADVVISVALMFELSIRQYLLFNPILGYGTMGALSLWSFLYGRRAKRRGEARRAAAVRLELGSLGGRIATSAAAARQPVDVDGGSQMTPKRRMAVAWVAILSFVIGICAIYGGRNCTAPKNGPFARLLGGHKYVPSHRWRSGGCIEVR